MKTAHKHHKNMSYVDLNFCLLPIYICNHVFAYIETISNYIYFAF